MAKNPHFSYGKDQVYPGNNFDYHLIPFEAAFQAGTAQIMPYYGRRLAAPRRSRIRLQQGCRTGLLRKR